MLERFYVNTLQKTDKELKMGPTIYTASKTKHAPKWIELRGKGYNVISTWIDEHQPGQTENFADLALRCIQEPAKADVTILYCEPGDYLKFALVEVGAALAAGKKIIIIGMGRSLSATMLHHPNIQHVQTIEAALELIEVSSEQCV